MDDDSDYGEKSSQSEKSSCGGTMKVVNSKKNSAKNAKAKNQKKVAATQQDD